MKKPIKNIIFILISILIIISIGLLMEKITHPAETTINVVSEKVVIPCGQSVGIHMNVKGVLIVGLEEIETKDGIESPGLNQGLLVGDTIESINGTPVFYGSQIIDYFENNNYNGSDVILKINRNGHQMEKKIRPALDYLTNTYKLGIWVKEKIAGIGTLTFYDPANNTFASLGHGIYESQTGTLLEVDNGTLLSTEVKSIKEGKKGKPGEIRGIYYADSPPIGEIFKNSHFGVYSKGINVERLKLKDPVIMGTANQVEKGPAYILTTIDGNRVEKFKIKITDVNHQDAPNGKGIELEVTDDRLLKHSGGIVQGMSGSPIIQNNRLIGAVTHVFVNNPKKGYGIFAQWMVEEYKQ